MLKSLINLTKSTTPLIRYSFTSLSTPPSTPLLQQVQSKIFQIMYSFPDCNRTKLTRASTFKELGLDSLDAVEAVCQMQSIFGFDIKQQQAMSITTVNKSIEVFLHHMNERMVNKLSKPINTNIK